MRKQLRPALVLFTFMAILTGLLYPLSITGISQTFFSKQANGSLIKHNGAWGGSSLIGQAFSDPRYFWGRPSATAGSPYTAFDANTQSGSAGSNLGPLSRELFETVQQRLKALQTANPVNHLPVPVDLVTASASGLDPHISPAAAYYQVPRIAALRGLTEAELNDLVDQFVEPPSLGFLGEARLNVLLLNLALDNAIQ
jgi:potassium-transporting ATPase KdpC subunit